MGTANVLTMWYELHVPDYFVLRMKQRLADTVLATEGNEWHL